MQVAVKPAAMIREREIPTSWRLFKRLVDIALGSLLFLALSPIVVLAAVAIACVTGGTPFYMQERVGMNGRRFKMYKLRTMVNGAHEMRARVMHLNECDGPVFKIRDDPRLHPLGSFLRRNSIDEIPNLINVILGDISMVGPRPALPSEVEHYDSYALRRLKVPQGVTCLWQINGRSHVNFDEWMDLDNRYVDTWTPIDDLIIIAKTVPAVLRRNGAH